MRGKQPLRTSVSSPTGNYSKIASSLGQGLHNSMSTSRTSQPVLSSHNINVYSHTSSLFTNILCECAYVYLSIISAYKYTRRTEQGVGSPRTGGQGGVSCSIWIPLQEQETLLTTESSSPVPLCFSYL